MDRDPGTMLRQIAGRTLGIGDIGDRARANAPERAHDGSFGLDPVRAVISTSKPWRVDNTCKAVLDDVAQALKNQADAKVVIVGFADPDEVKKRKNLAAERAVDAKAYLSGGEAKQAIDPSRLEVRTGSGGGQKTEYWLVPAGASFTQADTQPVDETKVKPIPDHPKPAAKKRAKPAQ